VLNGHIHIPFYLDFGANRTLFFDRFSRGRGTRVQQVLRTSQPTTMADSVKEGTDEERVKNRKRFELELEFVQALANPFYLHSLAQQGILYQPAFINYLKYLLYWKEKDYARFIL
jgi:SOH1